jgi:cobalt-precorrin-5B (C1)-methyltransferase
MAEDIDSSKKQLRRGWTTGACAAAAAKSAYQALLTGAFADPVEIDLPRGERPAFALARQELTPDFALAAIVKDAGDDPDVTHGATITVRVSLAAPGGGIEFVAGPGVGTVTLPGLPLAVGEPAINPKPRQIIAAAIAQIAAAHGGDGDVRIEISVPGGEALALKTWNPRLGILGGISILGTTGIVVPYSCSAWIHAIHRGIDVARALGHNHLAGATGRTSEAAVQKHHGLPVTALIDMGDFAGGMLKYLRAHPVENLTIAGGFAKLSKLAAGSLDLHSSRSRVDNAWLADLLAALGGDDTLVADARRATTAMAVRQLAEAQGLDLAGAIAARARETALATLAGGVAVEILVYDRAGELIGRAGTTAP